MANNYLKFSFAIERITDEEAAWTREYLATAAELEGGEWKGLTVAQKRDRFLRAVKENGGLKFQRALDNTDSNADSLWIYAEESGNPEMAAAFVQRFLKTWRPNHFVTFTYAETCSKMRLDEFGGGAKAITASWVSSVNAHGWAAGREVAMKKRGSSVPKNTGKAVSLTKDDWIEIEAALGSKIASLKRENYGPARVLRARPCGCDKRWMNHLAKIMRLIGPDGAEAAARGVSPSGG